MLSRASFQGMAKRVLACHASLSQARYILADEITAAMRRWRINCLNNCASFVSTGQVFCG